MSSQLTIGLVRRGYSQSGGAEAYLKRLVKGIVELGHRTKLFTTSDWPETDGSFDEIIRLGSRSAIGFADELEKKRGEAACDVLLSLERVWRSDIYRAGDGVHRAWLNRRKSLGTWFQNFCLRFNPKHRQILKLEKSLFLFGDAGAGRVIANSQMVKDEIVSIYRYPAEGIDIVRNGVPLEQFRFDAETRAKARSSLKIKPHDVAVLFAGSGWERKGLRFAIEAVEGCRDRRVRLLVVGAGNRHRYKSDRAQFFGEIINLPVFYAAADIFILPTIYDPFSNACLEALASGLPVVTTRANGFSEIMDDPAHGSVIDLPNDISGLRNALELWADDARRTAVRPAIVERASQFDISKNVAQTLGILAQTAARAAST